jgi:hypothetical protein
LQLVSLPSASAFIPASKQEGLGSWSSSRSGEGKESNWKYGTWGSKKFPTGSKSLHWDPKVNSLIFSSKGF